MICCFQHLEDKVHLPLSDVDAKKAIRNAYDRLMAIMSDESSLLFEDALRQLVADGYSYSWFLPWLAEVERDCEVTFWRATPTSTKLVGTDKEFRHALLPDDEITVLLRVAFRRENLLGQFERMLGADKLFKLKELIDQRSSAEQAS